MTNTTGLRINTVVQVTYKKSPTAEAKGYYGKVAEVRNRQILVELFPEAGETKPQFRTFDNAKIVSLITGV